MALLHLRVTQIKRSAANGAVNSAAATVHEGVAVCQMEATGITTDKGDLNRWIRKTNNILRDIRRKIAGLTDWIKSIKEELSQTQAPTLAAQDERAEAINTSMKAKRDRLNELKELLRLVDLYRDTKPIYDKWTGIKWKGQT